MLTQILSLLLGTAAGLLGVAFLARVWMQWARAPFRNPIGQFVITLTDWAARPLRRIIPGLFGIDFACVFAAWLVECVHLAIMAMLMGFDVLGLGGLLAIALAALAATVKLFVYLLMGVVILAALMSWISPYAPAASLFNNLAAPLLAPVRRLLPMFGGIDLSPLVVILLLQVLLIMLESLRPAALLFLP